MNLQNWISCIACALIGTTVGLTVGSRHANSDDTVTAKKFVLVNDDNESIGEFSSESGGAKLTLNGPEKESSSALSDGGRRTFLKSSITLSSGADNAEIHLIGRDQQMVELWTGDVFCGTLRTQDSGGAERLMLSATGKGKPVLTLVDKDDKKIDAFGALKAP